MACKFSALRYISGQYPEDKLCTKRRHQLIRGVVEKSG